MPGKAPLHDLIVTVVDQQGCARCEAILCIVHSPVVMPEVARLTNSVGQCRLRLAPGEYTLEAFDNEGPHRGRQSVVIPDQGQLRITLGPP